MSEARTPPLKRRVTVTRAAITTPRAAAVAGIVFALLFTTSLLLIGLAIPESAAVANTPAWLTGNTATASLALTLLPFAGISFLWFIGVVRDRLGELEDQFFSTVFVGSGLLFLAMIFTAAAIAGGIVVSYDTEPESSVDSGVISFGRAIMYAITNIYATRMAGVFMFSLGTLWIHTHLMPRPVVYITYILAGSLLIFSNFSVWLALVFPAWVFAISSFILITTLRNENAKG